MSKKDNAKQSRFHDFFTSNDAKSCETLIKRGAFTAFFSASVTILFAAAGMLSGPMNKTMRYFLAPWILIDVALGVFV